MRTAIPALRSFASRAMATVLLPRDNRLDAGGGGGGHLMMREKPAVQSDRGGTPIGREDEHRNRPSLHDADQHHDDLAGVRGDAPGVGSDPSGFLVPDLAAEPRVFTERAGRPTIRKNVLWKP